MANPVTANGSIYVDGQLLTDGVEITLNMAYETLTAEMAFGEVVAPKDLGPENVDGSFRFRYTQAAFDAIWAIYKAKSSVEIIATPVSGAGGDTFTFDAKLSSMPVTFKAGQVIYATSNFVCSAGAGVTKAPALTLATTNFGSCAAGAVSAFTGLSASGGTATYTYTVQSGAMPEGLSWSTNKPTGTCDAGANVGVYTFVIRVTDSASPANTKDFTCTLTITS